MDSPRDMWLDMGVMVAIFVFYNYDCPHEVARQHEIGTANDIAKDCESMYNMFHVFMQAIRRKIVL